MQSKVVANKVCADTGHLIQSLRTNDVVDPASKIRLERFDTLCVRCGLSLEDVRSFRQNRGNPNPKAPKKDTGGKFLKENPDAPAQE